MTPVTGCSPTTTQNLISGEKWIDGWKNNNVFILCFCVLICKHVDFIMNLDVYESMGTNSLSSCFLTLTQKPIAADGPAPP